MKIVGIKGILVTLVLFLIMTFFLFYVSKENNFFSFAMGYIVVCFVYIFLWGRIIVLKEEELVVISVLKKKHFILSNIEEVRILKITNRGGLDLIKIIDKNQDVKVVHAKMYRFEFMELCKLLLKKNIKAEFESL